MKELLDVVLIFASETSVMLFFWRFIAMKMKIQEK